MPRSRLLGGQPVRSITQTSCLGANNSAENDGRAEIQRDCLKKLSRMLVMSGKGQIKG